jgi:DSF synthase
MGCERYTAEECFEMGIIDILADEGQGEQAVYEFIDKQRKRAEGFISAQKAKKYINPVTYQELNSIVAEWVENALALTERDLKVMDRFLRAQEKLFSQVLPSNVATFKPISHETMDINRVAVNG